jgi:hypothetical protein
LAIPVFLVASNGGVLPADVRAALAASSEVAGAIAAGASGASAAIRWNSSSRVWPARGTGAFGQVFISTNDATATAPNDVNLLTGDRWIRHPDAT